MTIIYKTNESEERFLKIYERIGVTDPHLIDEKQIAKSLGIFLIYSKKRSYAVQEDDFNLININTCLSRKEQRECFFHELCHILHHYGSQLMMPKSFIDLQEFDCKRFTRYASLPFDMLKKYDLTSPNIIYHLSNDFMVPEYLCVERLEEIKNKHIQYVCEHQTAYAGDF